MNSLAKLFKLLPILFILLFACQPEEEQFMESDPDQLEVENLMADAEEIFIDPSARTAEEAIPCGDPKELALEAYRIGKVGIVSINNTVDMLQVKYESSEGYSLKLTMLLLMVEKKNTNNGKGFYSNYRKYVLPVNHGSGTQEYTYEIPYSKLDLMGDECIYIITIANLKPTGDSKNNRNIFALARQENADTKGIFKRYLIDYCMLECVVDVEPEPEPEPEPVPADICEVKCAYGFGIPSVDVMKSFTFQDLGLTDWPWGYVHEIKQETLFRLPIKMEDSETAPVVGQVTVMIEGNYIYIYYQMNDGYPMSKSKVYLSSEEPTSGKPCEYTYERDYTNPDGSVNPMLTDTYEFDNLDQIRDINQKLWIVVYADICE
jgi:hypothetical protein